jgi:hypothetical protein
MKILGRYIFERRPKFFAEDLVISSELQSVIDSLNDLDSAKQDLLVSGVNIKTINGQSVVGSGDLVLNTSSLFKFSAANYNDLLLVTGMVTGDLAYVYNSQGTAWLPGSMGGTYYPYGFYYYTGTTWTSDKEAISMQFNENIQDILAIEASLININGQLATKLNKPTITTVSGASYTVLSTDTIIYITSTTCTVTLPSSATLTDNNEFTFFFTDCNLTLQRSGSDLIDGETTWTLKNTGSFNVTKIGLNNYKVS